MFMFSQQPTNSLYIQKKKKIIINNRIYVKMHWSGFDVILYYIQILYIYIYFALYLFSYYFAIFYINCNRSDNK